MKMVSSGKFYFWQFKSRLKKFFSNWSKVFNNILRYLKLYNVHRGKLKNLSFYQALGLIINTFN